MMDLDDELTEVWAGYRAALESPDPASALDALRARLRPVLAFARKHHFRVHSMQLSDLQTYVTKARKGLKSPAERVRDEWPPLCATWLREATEAGESALSSGSVTRIRRAAALLKPTEGTEALADIAEEGLAAELAPYIPGATVDEGMLFLSDEHEAAISSASRLLNQLRAAIRGAE